MRLFTLLAFTILMGSNANAETAVDADLPAVNTDGVEGTIVGGDDARLETPNGIVHVWKPYGYARETAITVVFVHGYWLDVDDVWQSHGLPEQFGAAGINALFIACEAPVDRFDPVRWKSVSELLQTVERELGEPLPAGRVAVVGHSGAFRTLAEWVTDTRLDTMVLLAAGYGDLMPFYKWITGAQTRRLISIGSDTLYWTTRLHRRLRGTRTVEDISGLADPKVAAARVVHVRSEDIGHMQAVTGGVALPAILRALGAPPLAAPSASPGSAEAGSPID